MEGGEFECRQCGKIVFIENPTKTMFCPKCGTLIHLRPQPKHWLFQFSPKIYNWFDRIRETNEPEQWLISQHAKIINKDDLVAIWSSGQKSGVYAIGQITTNPEKSPLKPEQEKYFSDKSFIEKFRDNHSAIVQYSKIFLERPLLSEECNRDSVLLGMDVFMNPHRTNFHLSPEQWNKIVELLDGQ